MTSQAVTVRQDRGLHRRLLLPAIKAAASRDVINLLNPADHAKFGIDTGNSAPNSFTLQEKLEGMALVPDLTTPQFDDYFLFVANDNDFQTSQVKMLNSSGTMQNLGDGRQNVAMERSPMTRYSTFTG